MYSARRVCRAARRQRVRQADAQPRGLRAVVAGLADNDATMRYSTSRPNGSSVRSAHGPPVRGESLRDDAAAGQCAPLPGARHRKGRNRPLPLPANQDSRAAMLAPSLVVGSTCRIRCRASPSATTAAPASWSMRAVGVVDRNTSVSMGIASPSPAPSDYGKVEFVHPLRNLAIVATTRSSSAIRQK
jgi:hypothetical protein